MSFHVDLHCHSSFSDGTLCPDTLVALARERHVQMLSITDHDTDAAYDGLSPSIDGLQLIQGAEFSTRWRKRDVHIVALNFDRQDPEIKRLFRHQAIARHDRNERISKKLTGIGLPDALGDCLNVAGVSQIGRIHFADLLVGAGHAKSRAHAFKKFLGQGGSAYSKTEWAPIEAICETVSAANGLCVIAHPTKYGLSHAKLVEFVTDFKATGGHGIEVVSGKQAPGVTSELARLAARFELYASIGSDFHRPGEPWADLGAAGVLPHSCVPIWSAWRRAETANRAVQE